MNKVRIPLEPLGDLFRSLQAVTMPEMKQALGTAVDQTVFRKLAQLAPSYLTSYSHRGAFYTLDALPRFDADGLWTCRGAWFSRHGTLLDTACSRVGAAPAGLFAHELEAQLHVSVKDALLQLFHQGRLGRQRVDGLFLYTAPDRSRRQEQSALRATRREDRDPKDEALRAAIALFYSLLDEQQRRLYAGLESARHGHGGDRQMARTLGLDVATVARGRREVLAGIVERERVRRIGGGRPRAEKKRPTS